MTTPSNTAAWQSEIGTSLEIKSAPYTSAGENEIVVRNRAIAINPSDWILQESPLGDQMKYPMILGNDVAGEVVEVGSGVSRFKGGDRVLGQAVGCWTNTPAKGGFQLFTVLDTNLASHIPGDMAYAQAAVIPLGLGTASCGLFQTDQLALQYPSSTAKPTGETLLIWGGSSSVGCNGIQLAVAAGYEVIATASPKNFNLVKNLGASQAFDYNSNDIVSELVDAFKGKTIAGALFTVGNADACYQVVDKCTGNKFVASTLPIPENKPQGVNANQIFGMTLKDNEVSQAVYVDFLAKALSDGAYVPAPEPWIFGRGLESLQRGLEVQKKGVSAKKVVIVLE